MNKHPCIICDIDGTLANVKHRQHFVQNGRKNWEAFNSAMSLDTPYEDIIKLIQILKASGEIILIVSGREDAYREITVEWLDKNQIPFDGLFMRAAKDNRKDSIVKKEILDDIRAFGFEPWLVLDDRDQVVATWRENGIRCLQVQEGNF